MPLQERLAALVLALLGPPATAAMGVRALDHRQQGLLVAMAAPVGTAAPTATEVMVVPVVRAQLVQRAAVELLVAMVELAV